MYSRAPRALGQTHGSTSVQVGPGAYEINSTDTKNLFGIDKKYYNEILFKLVLLLIDLRFICSIYVSLVT